MKPKIKEEEKTNLPLTCKVENEGNPIKLALVCGAVVGLGVAAYKWLKGKGKSK